MLEAENFFHKMLTPGGGGFSHIHENDGTLFADQVGPIHVTPFFRNSHVCGDEGDKMHQCNYMEAELFVDGRLNSCTSNPFLVTAWCVKIAKKTQQPTLERCTTKMKSPFPGHKNADEHTIFLTLHYLRPIPEISADERLR